MLSAIKINSLEKLHTKIVKALNGDECDIQKLSGMIDPEKTQGGPVAGVIELLKVFQNNKPKGDHNADV